MIRSLILCSAFFLAACGGSSNSGSSTPPPSSPPPAGPSTQTGVFLDSAVANVDYETATQEGTTNADGEYEYVAGETVTFSIGALTFPPVAAAAVVTPLDIAGTDDPNDNQVVNMLRLLQTLDEDGDPSNGIQINNTAKQTATAVDFTLPAADFASSSAVTTLIQNAGHTMAEPPTALVSIDKALAHFEDTLKDNGIPAVRLTGTWRFPIDLDDPTVDNLFLSFTFLGDGTYLHAEVTNTAVDDEPSGIEWGEYARNRETGLVTVEMPHKFDQNGTTGLTDFGNGLEDLYVSFTADELTAKITAAGDSEVLDELVFERIANEGLLGTWLVDPAMEDDNDLLFIAFFEDGTYLHVEIDFNDQDEPSGMEWGEYSYNETTGRITVEHPKFDNNGSTGLSEFAVFPNWSLTVLSIENDVLTVEIDELDDEPETMTFVRLK